MNTQPIYQVTQETPISNKIVKELNAAVCSLTFPGKGHQMADLYRCPNSSDVLVSKGTCAPIHSEYERTVIIFIPE